ncbi:MAG: SMC-Scp complex subunit ScpB [Planctomycetales bacterium]
MDNRRGRNPEHEPPDSPAPQDGEESLSGEDLEAAYLRALEALDAAESQAVEESLPAMESEPSAEEAPQEADAAAVEESEDEEEQRLVSPRQVIAAALFVGGSPLTGKKLAGLFDAHVDHAEIETQIDELNAQFQEQNRPYEIRLGEGGYRMALRAEFEPLRNKVYGVGPREVKLSQDSLEVLALIAYQQPLSHKQLLLSGKKNVGSLVRGLIRRELVGIERVSGAADGVEYHTTPRFLSLFGLSGVDELPQIDDLALR